MSSIMRITSGVRHVPHLSHVEPTASRACSMHIINLLLRLRPKLTVNVDEKKRSLMGFRTRCCRPLSFAKVTPMRPKHAHPALRTHAGHHSARCAHHSYNKDQSSILLKFQWQKSLQKPGRVIHRMPAVLVACLNF